MADSQPTGETLAKNKDGGSTEAHGMPCASGQTSNAANQNMSDMSVSGWENFFQGFMNVLGKNNQDQTSSKRQKDHEISDDESGPEFKKSKQAATASAKDDLVKSIVAQTVQAMSGKDDKKKTPKKAFDTTNLSEGPYKEFMLKQKTKLEEKVRQGPEVEANLAAYLDNTFDEAATGVLKGEDMKEYIKKYPTPINLQRLVAPEVDDIVKNIVKNKAKNEYASIRTKCDHIKYLQRDLVASASALTQLATFMANKSLDNDKELDCEEESEDSVASLLAFTEHINEALHIIVFVIQKMNEDRQALWAKHMGPDTVEALKSNAAKGENPKCLYGGELVEVSKQVDAGRKAVSNSMAKPVQSTTPQKTPQPKQNAGTPQAKQPKKPYFKHNK